MIAIRHDRDADLDLYGLCRLLRALTAPCGCEIAKWSEECSRAPLDRRWVEMLTGVDRC